MAFELPSPEQRARARKRAGRSSAPLVRAVYWIDGDPYYADQVASRTGRTKNSISSHVHRLRASGQPLTWEALTPQPEGDALCNLT